MRSLRWCRRATDMGVMYRPTPAATSSIASAWVGICGRNRGFCWRHCCEASPQAGNSSGSCSRNSSAISPKGTSSSTVSTWSLGSTTTGTSSYRRMLWYRSLSGVSWAAARIMTMCANGSGRASLLVPFGVLSAVVSASRPAPSRSGISASGAVLP